VSYYYIGENRDLELYIAGWIIVFVALILFTVFNVHGRPYSAGNVGNNFTYLAIDKIEKLFTKPKRDSKQVDNSLLFSFMFLLTVNLVLYLVLFVL
tara:strand:+ start:287 stop:574 length:288 start_codon:yes stop_codon:yes gene_type:complete